MSVYRLTYMFKVNCTKIIMLGKWYFCNTPSDVLQLWGVPRLDYRNPVKISTDMSYKSTLPEYCLIYIFFYLLGSGYYWWLWCNTDANTAMKPEPQDSDKCCLIKNEANLSRTVESFLKIFLNCSWNINFLLNKLPNS